MVLVKITTTIDKNIKHLAEKRKVKLNDALLVGILKKILKPKNKLEVIENINGKYLVKLHYGKKKITFLIKKSDYKLIGGEYDK
jgi:mRNA-degrading endonuclease RelE of RelBE toxin-antitoxin system